MWPRRSGSHEQGLSEVTKPKVSPQEQAIWAERAAEYLRVIDEQIEGWRDVATSRMVQAVADGKGWAGNEEVEFAVHRISNMLMMRTVAEGVTDAVIVNHILNGTDKDN